MAMAIPAPLKLQDGEDTRMAGVGRLYSLHGPPGPPRAPGFALAPAAPFVEPRTAEFRVRVEERDLEVLLGGCGAGVPACPWQDVCEAGEDGGEVPEGKWVVFAEEGVGMGVVRVHMHRSWTGVKLIELTVDTVPSRPLLDGPADLGDDVGPLAHANGQRVEMESGPRITHITFETHEDYKLKGADEGVYKRVALEVCWWVLGVWREPEIEP